MGSRALSASESGAALATVRRLPLTDHRPLRVLLVKPDHGDAGVGLAGLARVPPLELLTVAAVRACGDGAVFLRALRECGGLLACTSPGRPSDVGENLESLPPSTTFERDGQQSVTRPITRPTAWRLLLGFELM